MKEIAIIFKKNDVSEKLKDMFHGMEHIFDSRVERILKVLNEQATGIFSKDNILLLFKAKFIEEITEYAVNKALYEEGCHNIEENIVSQLYEKRLNDSIMGRTMVETFIEIILTKQAGLEFFPDKTGKQLALLEEHF